jgi:ribosomal protein L34
MQYASAGLTKGWGMRQRMRTLGAKLLPKWTTTWVGRVGVDKDLIVTLVGFRMRIETKNK